MWRAASTLTALLYCHVNFCLQHKIGPLYSYLTGLEEWLRERKIDTITIIGYMKHNCDFSPAVYGMHAGFTVEILSDATGSVPYANRDGRATGEEIHRAVSVVMQGRFAAVMTTEEWITAVNSGVTPERDSIFSSNQRERQEG